MIRRRRIGGIGRVIAALALLTLVVWGLSVALSDDDGVWLTVERRDLVLGVPIEGDLLAVETTTIGPPAVSNLWNFKIVRLATDGVEVKAGQPVLAFETHELQQRLQSQVTERDTAAKQLEQKAQELDAEERQAELDLAEAKARRRKSDLGLEVPAAVARQREIDKARVEKRLAELEISHLEDKLERMSERRRIELGTVRARRDRAAAQVEEIQDALARMTISAPRDGTVILRADWRGEKKKIGDQVWRMDTVLEIPDLNLMRANVEVAEADIGRVAVGQPVTFQLDAYPDRTYRGTVARIRRAVQPKSLAQQLKVVAVQVDITETDRERMRPGMRLRGSIEIERMPSVLAVPSEAVRTDTAGPWVTVRKAFRQQRAALELGARDDTGFEVLEGLDEGDRVLVPESPGGAA